MTQLTTDCFCAFCKSSRRIVKRQHVTIAGLLVLIAMSLTIMFLIWESFNPKFIIILVALIGVGEVFALIRWRLSLICPQCGFDPVVYVHNRDRVVEKVKSHMEERRKMGENQLLPPLPIELEMRDRRNKSISLNPSYLRGSLLSHPLASETPPDGSLETHLQSRVNPKSLT